MVPPFLYAVFVFFAVFGLGLAIYFGDLLYNISHGNTKNPLFDAYVIVSPSMVPTIKIDDAIVVKREEGEKLDVGDIITFLSSDTRLSNIIVTHRIKAKYYDSTTGKYTFQTQGDANNTPDFTLAEDTNIIGEVIFKVPKLGYIQSLLATKGGLIIVVLIPCLAVLSYDIVKLGKNVKKKVSKKKSDVVVVRRWYYE